MIEPLHEHNQKTYENICRMYGEGIQRVAVVQPTGSGKSLLMAKLIEDNPDSRFFVLSTRHEINNQFKEQLNQEMLERSEFNIYCNMSNMKKEVMELLQPDYIFLDEMHRALAKEWSKGIKVLLEMYPNAKVLGLSATPIRYLDKCRNVAEELFSGNLACDMSLSQAILDGILPMARYVCGVYSYEKDAESLNKKIERSTNSPEEKKELLQQVKVLKENLDKGNGVSDIFRKYVSGNEKFVVFLKNIKHLARMKPIIKKWFIDAGFSSVRMYEVHCKNLDRDKEFQAFKDDTKDGIKLCLSINIVAEGIHGDINGVIMLRDTISANMYFQMIGRAFSCGKKTIPLIFDLVANSQFISNAADISFPNELRGEIEKRKNECKKENKDYEVGFDVDEFIVMDQFMDVVSGFKEIEGRLEGIKWTDEEDEILKRYYPMEGGKVEKRIIGKTREEIYTRAKMIGLKVCKEWIDEEIEILKKYYPLERMEVINRLEGKTRNAIKLQVKKLGLNLNKEWTEDEIEILKKYYPLEGSKVSKRLTNRTKSSIMTKIYELKIKGPDRKWTKEEDDILCLYYPQYGRKIVSFLPNRTAKSIATRAIDLGLLVENHSIFSKEEDEIIKQYYSTEGNQVYKRTQGKTEKQCRSRAKYLGVTVDNRWTEEEIKILKKYYPIEGIKIEKRLKRWDRRNIYDKAMRMGIKKNRNYDNIDKLKRLLISESSLGNVAKEMGCGIQKLKSLMDQHKLTWNKREKLSKYKYVIFDNARKKYRVCMKINGQNKYFGYFKDEDEAGRVAMEKAKEYGKAV